MLMNSLWVISSTTGHQINSIDKFSTTEKHTNIKKKIFHFIRVYVYLLKYNTNTNFNKMAL